MGIILEPSLIPVSLINDNPKLSLQQTLIRKEMVMKIEKINIPPSPYSNKVRLPIRSINGMEIKVMITIIQPIPMVANLALSGVKPAVSKRFVE